VTDPVVLDFRLPDLGEGLTDAVLVSWRVAVGDTIALNDTVAEVETAKALVELPSPFAGTVTELLGEPGDTIPVGTTVVRIHAEAGTEPQRQAMLVGYGPEAARQSRRRRPAATTPDPKLVVLRTRPAPAATAGTGQEETRTKIAGVRKRTADAMALSARTIPTVTEFLTLDVTGSMAALEHLRGTPAFAETKLTPLALVAKVALIALAEHPDLNSSWDEDHGDIVTKHYVNLGIAVAGPRGLLAPNIKGAHHLALPELGRRIAELAAVARDGRCTPADLTGGTFTITNVGVFGVDAGTPIINPGEAAILCLGAIRKRPWVVGDEIVPRMVTTLGVSFDHRLIDGEQAARFLTTVGAMLEDPLTLLAKV